MKHWMKIAGATICFFVALASPALAGDSVITLPARTGEVIPSDEVTLRGILTYMDLEGGFYSVDGWMLRAEPAIFEPHLGKVVLVTGTVFDGASIQMVKSLTVSNIAVDPDAAPILAPIVDEAGFEGIAAARPAPTAISVDGRPISFDQGPVVSDSLLMVPLRFVVEAAGGEVHWDGENHRVTVRLLDRVVLFAIGGESAEIITPDRGARRLLMAKAPVLAGGRTLVSADALSAIGFVERNVTGAEDLTSRAMDLTAPAPDPLGDQKSVLSGIVKEVETGDTIRILVEGAAMSNGEPNLTWVTIGSEAKVSIEENGQVRNADACAISEGQVVEVEINGAIAMSYPALASAASVLIKR